MAIPTFAHTLNVPAAHHEEALSLICAGVLLAVFLVTLPGAASARCRARPSTPPPRWTNLATVLVLSGAAVGAAFASDWFVTALKPATETLGMSEEFAGLVVVAIAGNAVENVVGVQLALQNRMDSHAGSVIGNSYRNSAAKCGFGA